MGIVRSRGPREAIHRFLPHGLRRHFHFRQEGTGTVATQVWKTRDEFEDAHASAKFIQENGAARVAKRDDLHQQPSARGVPGLSFDHVL